MSYSTRPNDVLIPGVSGLTNTFVANLLVTNMFVTVGA